MSIRLSDCLLELRRRHSLPKVCSFHIQANRLPICSGVRSFRGSKASSSSEKVKTQDVKVTTTCSTIIRAVRDLAPTLVPKRKDCSWVRQTRMSETSCRTPFARAGAPLAPRIKVVRTSETFAAAPSTPTTEAATERGSILWTICWCLSSYLIRLPPSPSLWRVKRSAMKLN